MSHLTEEEKVLVGPLLKKYGRIAHAAGKALAQAMTTEKHVKDVNKMGSKISLVFAAGAAVGYFMDTTWLLYLSLLLLFSYGVSLYAYKRVMQEKIERLFDKVDVLTIDWIVEFGDDKAIQQDLPKHHFDDAVWGIRFNTETKAFDLWWAYQCGKVYRRVLGRDRAAELTEIDRREIDECWPQHPVNFDFLGTNT